MLTMNKEDIVFVCNILSQIAIFSKLTPDEKYEMSLRMSVKKFHSESIVIKKGDCINWFGIVAKGNIKMNTNTMIGCGQYFGEESLISTETTNAKTTLKATSNVVVCYITKTKFQKLFGNILNWKRWITTFDNINDQNAIHVTPTSNSSILHHQSINTQTLNTKWLRDALRNNSIFVDLNDSQLMSIVKYFYCVTIEPNKTFIKKDDNPKCMYVVEDGIIAQCDNNRVLKILKCGELLGTYSLLYNIPYTTTYKTIHKSKLWCIHENNFKTTLQNVVTEEQNELSIFLSKINGFHLLTNEERSKLSKSLDIITFRMDDIISKAGQIGTQFYIVKQGIAIAKSQHKLVGTYGAKKYFGQRSMLTNTPETVTISAASDITCLSLSYKVFKSLPKSVKKFIQSEMFKYEHKILKSSLISSSNGITRTDYDNNNKNNNNDSIVLNEQKKAKPLYRVLSDMNFIKPIGEGSYATVWLVQDNITKKSYALKQMNKRKIEDKRQQKHVVNEKKILECLHSDFTIQLYSTFKDEYCIYMLMDLGLCGDLFSYLTRHPTVTELDAKFFMGCVVLGFEYLHKEGVVYRDLKPENLIFDSKGYLKITDFGFAKKLKPTELTYTSCGTPVYLAPEVIMGKGHSFAVDWWTSGIFLYELMMGSPPFEESNFIKTCNKILHQPVKFECNYFSEWLQDLICKLLRKQPSKRLGHSLKNIQKIKSHPWFDDFNWTQLENGEMKSPFQPTIENTLDTKYFDPSICKPKPGKQCKNPNAEWLQHF